MFKPLLFLFLLIIPIFSMAQERQVILWNKNQVAIELGKGVSISIAEKIHYSPERSSLDSKYAELFLGHELKQWLEYGAGFRFTSANLQNGSWLQENRPMIFITLNKDLNKFELDFSNRMEYRTYKELENHFRHRQAFQLKFPELTTWGMQFFLMEETFYKLNGQRTHLARLYSGLTALDTDHVAIKVYYAFQKQKILNSWFTVDVMGLNLSFDI
ncbi:DUF2490 domain-containing protein [uncultured Draconibacterium sp.]|uniref:DUF2490 domain-containing protein n=1 Tax=uncultured Draconibacterium sp. TaxID=1573823 RepID=UPI0032606DED